MQILDKGATKIVEHQYPDQFLSNILLLRKKDGGNRLCINWKALNKFIPYKHFKMEGLHCLKYLLEIKDFLCKVDLKNACFSVPLCMSSREFVIFAWSGKLYDLLSLFWIRAGSQDIFKTIKGINSSIEVAEHSSSHISRRYSSDGNKCDSDIAW